MEKVLKLGNPKAIHIFTLELLQLHRGQGMEIYWRDSGICPSEEEYIEMVKNSEFSIVKLINLRNGWITSIGGSIDATLLSFIHGLYRISQYPWNSFSN